jgi:diaminopimelate decarboxylase
MIQHPGALQVKATIPLDLRTTIAGVPVRDLASRFGTPTYVYDAATIVERIGDLKPFDAIRYAQKANSNLAILDLVRRHGVLVDAVSAGEIGRALAAGYRPDGDPHPIVYTADIFDRESLDLVAQKGIHVNCGSPDMIEQYGERIPGGSITLRINPGFGHGHSQKTNTGGESSKHGIWHDQLGDCLSRAARHDLRITGLHMHIGSGTDLEHLSQVCGAMERVARGIAPTLDTISAGGGLPPRTGRPTAGSTSTPTSASGTPHASGSRRRPDTHSAWRSSRAATLSLRAASSSPRSAPSSAWAATPSI